MKKVLCILIAFILIISSNIVCYSKINEELFIEESDRINININFNDNSVITSGYMYYDRCFIEVKDFINLLGNKYIDINYTECDELENYKNYFGKFSNNKDTYYFYTDNRNYSIYDIDCFETVFAEKVSNGKRENLFISGWTGSDAIKVNNKVYINMGATTYLLEDLGYMIRMDINNKIVTIKKYNNNKFIESVDEKYNVKSYCNANAANEDYYKPIVKNYYDIYSGINSDNVIEICKKLLNRIWGIEASDVYIKYDSILDVYIVSPRGNYKKTGDRLCYIGDYDNVIPKIIIRGFDGKVLYPY